MSYNFGYTPDHDAIAKYAESLGNLYADDVSQIVTADDGADVFLWRAFVECLKNCSETVKKRWLVKNSNDLWSQKSFNQGQIGSCVGNAEGEVLSVELALNILVDNMPMVFTAPVSAEACYAVGREAGGMLGSGDGSYGSAMAKGATNIGVLFQQKYDGVDLSEYSVNTCRAWGARGMPANLKPIAAQFKLNNSYQIKSVEEAWALIGAGNPINQCSNLGFTEVRDKDGACRQSGTWNHSMALIGRRTTSSGRKLFICINSWGENWISGPLYKDQPQGSFGIDYDVVARAVAQKDMFVKIGMNGLRKTQRAWSDL